MSAIGPFSSFLARAYELGAEDAVEVRPASVVTAEWVRLKCQYGCGGFGSNLCCPPYSPTPQQTRSALDSYSSAILVHAADGPAVHAVVVTLERELFLAGYHKAFAMSSGPCRLCDECARERCIRPAEARPSMEACGIDVFATVRASGLPIDVVRTRSGRQNCYGLVLVE
jgi:predicted metal-binding protein